VLVFHLSQDTPLDTLASTPPAFADTSETRVQELTALSQQLLDLCRMEGASQARLHWKMLHSIK